LRVSRKSFLAALLFSIFAVSLFEVPAEAKKGQTGFLDRTVAVGGTEYKYQVFVPEDWTDRKKWPVILFLHGAGERGDDGLIQTEVGIGTAIRRGRSRVPAIVVMPQCRKDVWWTSEAMGDVAMAALAQAQKEFRGDSQRVYLTGLSMGGYGTWYLAGKYPGKFAAIAPICGGILMPDLARKQSPDDMKPYTEAAGKIGKGTPTWIFHGGDDPVVPTTESQRMAAAMKALGGEVKYTEYPGVGHNSWEKAYAEPELFTWILSKALTPSTSRD
jgi:predicted peptidase